jgi:CRISPR-associated protein Csd1
MVEATSRAESDDKGRLRGYDADGVSPLLAGAVTRAVLTGGPYPQALMTSMVRRLRTDGVISHERMVAIKGCLVRNSRLGKHPREISVALDTNNRDPAYVTGRLFALLEKIQTDSSGGELNRTIRDTFFSAASATPGIVFPRLLRLSQHHLGKMSVGQRIFYEKQIGQVVDPLTTFPRTLGLEGQGMFAIGYYHQRQDLFTKKPKEEHSDE